MMYSIKIFCCSMLGMCQYFVLFNIAAICIDYRAWMMIELVQSIGGMSLSGKKPKYSRKILNLSILCVLRITVVFLIYRQVLITMKVFY